MNLTLNFHHASGMLHRHPDADQPGAPELIGALTFALSDEADGPILRLEGTAWNKLRDGQPFLSLSFCGLPGELFPDADKCSPLAPDFNGWLGPQKTLVLLADIRDCDGHPSIALEVVPSCPVHFEPVASVAGNATV